MITQIHATSLATERAHIASAFHALEGEVCDLTRMARFHTAWTPSGHAIVFARARN
jgi:hypothetical protein